MRPPWVLERVLESFITDRELAHDVLGDLAEEWAERASHEGRLAAFWWYAWQAARSVGHLLLAPGPSPMPRRSLFIIAVALVIAGALVVLANGWAAMMTGISSLAVGMFSAGGGEGGETVPLTATGAAVWAGRALVASAGSGVLAGLVVAWLSRRGAMVNVLFLAILCLPVTLGLLLFTPKEWPLWYSVALPLALTSSTVLGGVIAITLTPRRSPSDPGPPGGGSRNDRGRLGPPSPAGRMGDVSHAFRRLSRNPRFTLTAVVLLALGIGSTTAIFSVVDAVYLDEPPHILEPDRLVRLHGVSDRSGEPVSMPYPDFAYYDENQRSFEGLMGWGHSIAVTVGRSDGRSPATGMFVSHDYFDVLGVRPAVGRWFRPDEDGTSAQHLAAVISHGLWSLAFDSDPGVLGQSIRLNGAPFVVVGVAPEGFSGPSPLELPPDLWVPFHSQPVLAPLDWPLLERPPNGGGWNWVQGIGRLRSGVSPETARAELGLLSTDIRENFAAWTDGGVGVNRDARFLANRGGSLDETLALMMVTAVALLLIAGANVAILQLVRASEGARDLSVRIALGASRGRVAFSALTESLLLGGAGTLAGVGLAYASSGLVASLLPATFSVSFDPDPTVLAFACVLGLVVAVVSGLVPAMRVAQVDVNRTLKGDAGAGRTRSKTRNALIVAQVALGVGFASVAALTARSFVAANSIPFGFAVDGRTLISTTLSSQGYRSEEGQAFIRDALERLRAVPGVQSASSMSNVPFLSAFYSEGFRHPEADPATASANMGINEVSSDFFATMEIELLAGRGIRTSDVVGVPAIVVSQSTARSVWPGQDPLGQRLYGRLGQPLWEVVGVAEDTRVRDLNQAPELYGYTSVAQDYRGDVTFVIRGEAPQVALRSAMYEGNPSLAISDVRSLESVVSRVLSPYRTSAALMNSLGILSLLLAVVGLHGVLSYAVEQGRRDIGIRVALGASKWRVASGVVGWAFGLALLGSAIGGLGAWLGAPALASFLYEVDPRDIAGWIASLVALVVVVAGASLLPAHRAASLDPAEMLKDG
jgi:predicted permease